MFLFDTVNIFDGPYTEDKYNQFFNPNICHVCKWPSKNLITCNQCHMIFYCSKEHQEIHKYSHSEICTAIAVTITDKSFWAIYRNSEEWIESRKEILRKILAPLSRCTNRYETEMFMCAKSCYVCYKQVNIKPCIICYSANFCDDHQTLFSLKHKDYCNKLLLLLNINIAYINGEVENFLHREFTRFTNFPGEKPYHNIISFIHSYVPITIPCDCLRKWSKASYNWILGQYLYSDYVSVPLTLYYALQQSNLLSVSHNALKYIVHLLDASKTDVIHLKIWHIFLHLFAKIKELYIVFIKSPIFESQDLGSVCLTCCRQGQKLYIKYVSESYNDYVRLESFEQPNVILLLETENIFVGTWFKSIKAIVAQECPLLLTTDSERTAQRNVDKIQKETGTTRKRLYRKNKFCGCTPYRNYLTGGFYYRNEHFIMYL